MKFLILLIVTALLSACVNSYEKFYTTHIDAKRTPEVVLLAESQEPEVYSTDDSINDVRALQSQNYLLVGESSFNGGYEDIKNAVKQAKRIGATIVLVNSEYTNTLSTTTTTYVPDIKTTTHYGTLSGNTTYNSPYVGYVGSSNTTGNYSGTSTTYGTKAVTNTAHQRRYNQNAMYFVKTTKKWAIGFYTYELTSEQRSQYGTHTGAFIGVVMEGSPAFGAKLYAGDVIIAIDGEPVRNNRHLNLLLDNVLAYKKLVEFTINRQGDEKIIDVYTN